MRYRHLVLLTVVARTSNLHLAAGEMNLSQPAATKILQDLEDILETKLFERNARGMTPTDIGRFVISYAQQVLVDTDNFMNTFSTMKRGGFGRVAVGAIIGAVPGLIRPTIVALKKETPLMTISLAVSTSDRLLDSLERRELDLVLGRFSQLRHESLFNIEHLLSEEVIFYVHSSHPLAKRKHIIASDLIGLSWVLQPNDTPLRQIVERYFAEKASGTPTDLVETSSFFAAMELVRTSGMISATVLTAIEDRLLAGEFTRLNVEIDSMLEHYGLITRLNDKLSNDALRFIEFLRKNARMPLQLVAFDTHK